MSTQPACTRDHGAKWFADRVDHASRAAARRACYACPLRMACVRESFKAHQQMSGRLHGIWGGLDELQRTRIENGVSTVADEDREWEQTQARVDAPQEPGSEQEILELHRMGYAPWEIAARVNRSAAWVREIVSAFKAATPTKSPHEALDSKIAALSGRPKREIAKALAVSEKAVDNAFRRMRYRDMLASGEMAA